MRKIAVIWPRRSGKRTLQKLLYEKEKAVTLTPDYSNIASVPFVAMALQTQEEINRSYLRKMNKDYAAHIPNLYAASESHLSEIQYREQSNKEKCNE